MVKIIRIASFLFISGLLTYCGVSRPALDEYLKSVNPIVSREKIEADSIFSDSWLLWVRQPLDHNDHGKGYFNQRVWLSHKSTDAPVVFVTEGYMAPRNYTSELARIVEGNQVIVEHRYFDRSAPDSINWDYLTIEQAAKDHHQIVKTLKKYYRGKWISTGISKGGHSAMIHRALYPDDVDITVPYVAPFNLEREDPRLIDFFDTVGTPDQRKRIFEFQKEVLKRKDELLPLFYELSENQGYTYRMGKRKAFELAVLEYPFSLWQWCGPVDEIPEQGASAEELFSHLQQSSDFGYFSDQQWEAIGPYFYQAYKELGYYPYLASPLKPWLDEINEDTVSNQFMAPQMDQLIFDKEVTLDILKRLKKADPEMIVITGENDPWSATSIDPEGFNDLLNIEKEDGCHRTRINNLPDSQRKEVINQLNKWLN